jgi:hypothetical protein
LLVSAIALSAALVLAPTAIGQDEGAILDPLPDPSPSTSP